MDKQIEKLQGEKLEALLDTVDRWIDTQRMIKEEDKDKLRGKVARGWPFCMVVGELMGLVTERYRDQKLSKVFELFDSFDAVIFKENFYYSKE